LTPPGQVEIFHLECAVDTLGSDHILFGSDYPTKLSSLNHSLEIFRQARFSEEDKRKILEKTRQALNL